MTDTGDRDVLVSLIAAMDQNDVIGADGGMPWHVPDDLKWFKQQTEGRMILMGRRTFDAIGRALPKRRNLVMTRQSDFDAEGIETVADLHGALRLAREAGAAELMVIGGAEVFALALPHADRLLLTRIEARYTGDTWFPAVPWSRWALIDEKVVAEQEQVPAHRFLTYERRLHD